MAHTTEDKETRPPYHCKAFTDLEIKFIEEYLQTLNAAESARRAGYSPKTAMSANAWVCDLRTSCPENKRHVWDAVKQAIADRSRQAKIDANFVLVRLAQMIDADPVDIIDEETGAYKKIHDWPLVWRRMLSAADVKELFGVLASGEQKKIGQIIKYKFIDKLKAYELLGKHVNVQAFKDAMKVEGAIRIDIESEDANL